MPKLILDAMGGDYGPHAILEGVVQALPELVQTPGDLVILGDEKIIQPLLRKRRFRSLADAISKGTEPSDIEAGHAETRPSFRISLVHSSQTIEMEDSIRAIRSKPQATINLGCQMAAEAFRSQKNGRDPKAKPRSGPLQSGRSDLKPAVFISAGHSGAIMASALLQMGRLAKIERPAIAVKLPTLSPDGCVLIDVGANVDCKPEHLRDFAIMGAIYAQVERESEGLPKIGILSNGEERKKGNELTRSALALIEKLSCFDPTPQQIGKFVGYSEGKEIFKGKVDVVVTDGFVGNVVLKAVEGLGAAVITVLKTAARGNPLHYLGFLFSAGVFSRLKRKFDYAEYGAAPLLGVAGYVFICHGRSNPKAIKNALLRARAAANTRYVEKLEETLTQMAM